MLSGVLQPILIGGQLGLEAEAFLLEGDLRLKAADVHLDEQLEVEEPLFIRRYNARMTVRRREDVSFPT